MQHDTPTEFASLEKMTGTERRVAFSLGSIFAFRMLGLFMILPVFSVYAHTLSDATPTLIGIALGCYGLTQALLQIPFGMLSDRFGRKRLITFGLILFALGSIIAATGHSITTIILGRTIQGAGAIGSTIIALMADLTREEHRSKAMALIGMTIGLSFSLAMLLGPLITRWFGVPGIFWLTAIFAVVALFLLYRLVPNPQQETFHRDTTPEIVKFWPIFKQPQLLRLNIGIFSLHAILTASFVAIPIALQTATTIPLSQQWQIYLPILLLAFALMLPAMIIAEKKFWVKPIFLGAIVILGIAQLWLSTFAASLWGMASGLLIFLAAFSLLESLLPALVTRFAPASSKGTATGIYSTWQFMGIFIGGAGGGWVYAHFHFTGVFIACAVLAFTWLIITFSMQQPPRYSTFMLKLGELSSADVPQLTQQLLQVRGVMEATITEDDGVAYLRIDKKQVDSQQLLAFLKNKV